MRVALPSHCLSPLLTLEYSQLPSPLFPAPPPPSPPLEKALAKTAAEVTAAVPGAAVAFYVCDLSKRDAIYAAAEKVQASEGHPDVVLNNAGVVSGSYFLDTSDAKNELTMKVRRQAAVGQAVVGQAAVRQAAVASA